MIERAPLETEEDEIDIKAWLYDIYHYKYIILFFVLLFTLASSYYAYFLPDVYRATASVKVGLDEEDYTKDVISMAMGKGAINAATEKDLIQSRYLAELALKNVDFRQHYYTIRDFKEVELYKDAPFRVEMTKGYDIPFHLYGIDSEHYRLFVDTYTLPNGKVLDYNQVHSYNESVETEDFHLKVMKKASINNEKYRFLIDKKRKSFGQVKASQNSENSTILQISVEDTVAKRAQEYANALAEAYVKQNVENKTREAVQRLSFIEAQLRTISTNIKESATDLESFRQESKIVNVNHISETIATRLDNYEADLMKIVLKEQMLNNFYTQLKSSKYIETLSIEGIEDKESILAELMQKLQDAIVKKKELREDYTNLHPLVLKVTRKIIQLKSTILNTTKNLRQNLETKKALLIKSIEKQRTILNTLPENQRKYGELERKFKMNEEISSYLMKRKSEAEMIKASTVSKNRMLDRALLPYSPIKPKRESIIIIGAFLGLLFGVLVAFISILLDTKIKDEGDISQITDYPVLGHIPHFDEVEEGWKGKIKVFDAVKSSVAEAFRHLRSNLQFVQKSEGSQVILLTSTVGKEGKTTISVNLGAIMSLAKKRTIIINLDMRKPTLHERFDLPNHTGLSELINGRAKLEEVIQTTRYPYLDIISSGAIPPNPSELIQSNTMYEILEALKQGYEMIILDTPPIGLVTDAKELMHYVDINIYIVRADYSKKEFLHNLKKFDYIEKIPNLGIVLNDVKRKKGHYGYYSGYGDGYYDEIKAK
ncbi:capsular biosynthesis protein [Sulfurovum lithotrophicum]|nr:capsular biosynthesis protein [Sulfurovum lithotrophicum]